MDRNLWQKSTKTSFVARPSERIVILKPAPQNAKHTENVTCHCSSLQSRKKLSRRASDIKPTTSFSFREMKRKLKHTFGVNRKEPSEFSMVGTSDELSDDRSTLNVDIRISFDSSTKGNLRNEEDRKKLDISSVGISNKQEFDVVLEAKKHLSARFKNLNAVETLTSKKTLKTLGRILSSPEHEFRPVSPRRDGQHGSGFAQMRFSSYKNGREGSCLSPSRPSTDDMKSNGESKAVEMDSIPVSQSHASEVPSEIKSYDIHRKMQTTDTIELQKADETDSLSENEVSTSTVGGFPSTPSSIHQLDVSDSIKYQEEHRSPVSVLEPFFIEDANSPPSVTLPSPLLCQNTGLTHYISGQFPDGQQLKPRRLDFEECSFASFPQDPPNPCTQEQNNLSQYVHSVLQASCLNWDQLSEITSQPEDQLLDSFLFDEVEILPSGCYFDPKLLFDLINEVLLEIYKYHFCFPPWLAFVKPKIRSVPVAELVLGEIMTEADFYPFPRRTEKRTLDLVSKDVAKCRSWIDVRLDTEEIVDKISEDVLEESILDILLEFYT